MLLPSILAENAPSFLRAIGSLPVAFMLPAIGLDTVWTWLSRRWGRVSGAIVCGLSLLVALTMTTLSYFGAYSTSRELHEAFDAAPVEMAVQVNRWLGAGWQGHGIASSESAMPARYVWLDEPLWNFSIAVPFLVTETPTQSARLRFTPIKSIPPDAQAIKIFALPTNDPGLSLFPRGWRIRAQRGSTVGGVPGQEPYLLYVSFEAEPARDVKALAHFGSHIELVAQETRFSTPDKLVLHTEWRTTQDLGEDWTIFVHVVHDGQVIAQSDGMPADGLMPTSQWRAGDVIVDERELPGPFVAGRDQVRVGLYRPDTSTRLSVQDAADRFTGLDYWPIPSAR
jgi:hypothetical protein